MEPGMKTDCRAALEKLYEYLDNELAPAERAQIAAHLEECRPCLSRFELEGLFQEYVIARAPRPQAQVEFKARVLARLAEERAADEAEKRNPRPSWVFWQRFALAAVIVLAVSASARWISGRYGPHAADWSLLSAYHHGMVDVKGDGIETTDFSEARAFLVSRFDVDLDRLISPTLPEGMVCCSARVESWSRTQLAHLGFVSDYGRVSLFMLPAASFVLADEPRVVMGDRVYRTATAGCCRAVCWQRDRRYVCALIGDCEISRLLAMAEGCHHVAASTGERPVIGGEDHTISTSSAGL